MLAAFLLVNVKKNQVSPKNASEPDTEETVASSI